MVAQAANTPVFISSPGISSNIVTNIPSSSAGTLGNYSYNQQTVTPFNAVALGRQDPQTPTNPDGVQGIIQAPITVLDVTPYASGGLVATTGTVTAGNIVVGTKIPVTTGVSFIVRDADGTIISTGGLQNVTQDLYPGKFDQSGRFKNLQASLPMVQLDVPRNVKVVVTTGTVSHTVRVDGLDVWGNFVSENISATVAAPGTGKKAFAFIFAAVVVGLSATSTATIIEVKTGDLIGLPYFLPYREAIIRITYMIGSTPVPTSVALTTATAGDTTSPATATTGDVRGTVDPTATANAAAFNGVNRFTVMYYVPGATASDIANNGKVTLEGIYGQQQYSFLGVGY